MRTIIIAAAIAGLTVGAAFAQAPAANTGPRNTAVNTNGTNNPNATAPVAGANSFTEAEARARIQARGFSNITALTKDANGVWRGKAQRGGQTADVAIDYQGNVFPN